MNKNKPKSERGHPLRHTNITKCKPKVVVKKNLSRAKSLSVVAKSLVKSAQARHARHGSTKNSNVPYQKL